MKYIKSILFLSIVLTIFSCSNENEWSKSNRIVCLSVSMPESEHSTRVGVNLIDGSKNLSVSFSKEDNFSIYIRQGDVIEEVENVTFTVNGDRSKKGMLSFVMPEFVNLNLAYTMYGVCGASSRIDNYRLIIDDNSKIDPHFEFNAPVWFEFTGQGTPSAVQCQYIGTFIVIHIDNQDDDDNLFKIWGVSRDALYEDIYWDEKTKSFSEVFGVAPTSKAVSIPAGKKAAFIYNGIPNGKIMETLNISMLIGKEITWGMETKRPSTPKNVNKVLEQGRAYHVYLTWDGKDLKFTDGSDDLPNPENSKIIMTTAKTPGEQLEFGYFYGKNIWFDMNNNGVRELGEYPEGGSDHITFRPTVQSQTFTIYGNITGSFDCGSDNFEHGYNRLTSIDMSEFYGEMEQIFCAYNELTQLILPKSTLLNWVWCSDNQLTELDASELPSLKALYANNNILTSVKLPRTVNLEKVDIQRNYSLTSLDVRGLTCLNELRCQNCRIDMLDVSQNPELLLLLCDGNRLTSLDLSANQKLLALGCNYNSLDKQALETIYSQLPDVTHEIENIENIINDPQLFRMLRADHNPGYDEADQTIATSKGWEFEDKWIASSRQRGSSGEGGQR